jgi:GxxExxY protein
MKTEYERSLAEIMSAERGDPLTYAVIGEAMRVHRDLGPGLDESFYHKLLSARLAATGIAHQFKPRGELFHRGFKADVFECDLLFSGGLVAELKVLSAHETFPPEHLAQLISYLKFRRIHTGLLLDFGKERLVQRRIVFTDKQASLNESANSVECTPALSWKYLAERINTSIARVVQKHGLGYCDTTYGGLLAAEFSAEKIPFSHKPVVTVRSGKSVLGETCCDCFVVDGKVVLLVLALRNQITTTDRAIVQTYMRHLGLQGGIAVNFGKQKVGFLMINSTATRSSGQL